MDKRAEGFTISIVDYVPRDAKDVNPVVALNNFWKIFSIVAKVAIVITIAFMMFGCATTGGGSKPQTSYQPSNAVKGAGIGAILGGIAHAVIGGDTQQGLAIVGGSLLGGYLVGNEKDKSQLNTQTHSNKRVYQSQVSESYPSYGQAGNNRRYNSGYQEMYADGSPRTKYRKTVKNVTKNGKTETTETETIVSTKTEDGYYE